MQRQVIMKQLINNQIQPKLNSSKKQSRYLELGATMIEMAIALPVMIALLFAIIEACRLLTIQGLLDTTASRTLSYAAVVPGLENADAEIKDNLSDEARKTDPYSQAKEAVSNVRQYGEILPLNTWFNYGGRGHHSNWVTLIDALAPSASEDRATESPLSHMELPAHPVELILPAPGGKSLKEVLNNEPIEIRIHARVKSYFPFINTFNLTGRAAGFREPRFNSNLPSATDCNGNPLEGNLNPNLACTCPRGVAFNVITQSCACPADAIQACIDAGRLIDPSTCQCNRACIATKTPNATAKKCVCSADARNICSGTNQLLGENCKCETETCGTGTVDTASNTCLCTNEVSLAMKDVCNAANAIFTGHCACGATCENQQTVNTTTQECECVDLRSKCTPKSVLNPDICGCGYRCGGYGDPDPETDYTTCKCSVDEETLKATCLSRDKAYNLKTCGCNSCSGSKELNTLTGSCECRDAKAKRDACVAENKTFLKNSCQCSDSECLYDAKAQVTSTGGTLCSCQNSCPAGTIQGSYQDKCECLCDPDGDTPVTLTQNGHNSCAPKECLTPENCIWDGNKWVVIENPEHRE